MTAVLGFFAIIVVVATLLPLSRNSHWFMRGMDFPRVQIGLLSAVILATASMMLDFHKVSTWLIVSSTFFCLIWQLWWVLPFTQLWLKEVKTATCEDADKHLSILTSNVLTPNRNSDALINLVKKHDPDVLVTLESDQWWENKLKVLEDKMCYTVKCPLDNLYGMHLYSKLPIEEAKISYLVEKDVPSIHAMLTLRSGAKIRVHFLHPAPPSPTENEESTQRDAELVMVAKSVSKDDQPIIVTGDLNDVAWSSTTRLFRKVSGLLDPRVGRGMFNTFNVDYPFLRWPLDHLFHSRHFTLHSIERLPTIGSDHFPLLTRLQFAAIDGADQEGLTPDDDDKQRSEAIIGKAKVDVNRVPHPTALGDG